MPHHRIVSPAVAELDLDGIRQAAGVPGPFPAEVVAAATTAARGPRRPDHDATDLPLVTIDPPGSRDLDQAVAVEERPGGWRVRYAIADVAAWVEPGDAVDTEAWSRTQTYYAPDRRVPLHPPVLSEEAASLLPDGDRPAVLWTIDVDEDGSTGEVDVRRAMVRSRAQLTYAQVQADVDAGRAPEALRSLPSVGAALLAAARRRGAIELGLPEQEVVLDGDGRWTLRLRADLPVEAWNAEISLLTGRAAASIMLEGGVGLLRTLPRVDPAQLPRLRRAAGSLGITWPEGADPGSVLASLDAARPRHAAFAELAAELLRGAGYTAFAGAAPDDPGHAGVGAPYAHVTAPLRRLVDRFGTEACLALVSDGRLPGWLQDALPRLPERMAEGDRAARSLEGALVSAVEAFVLRDRVGHEFDAAVVEDGEDWGTVVLDDPPVRARCDTPDLPLGERIRVRCTEADVAARTVRFVRVG